MKHTHRIRVLAICIGVAATAVLQGCASKGYVNDRIEALQQDQDALRTQQTQLRNSAQEALERAQSAGVDAGEARDLALGKAGLEEMDRYTVYFAFDSAKLDEDAGVTLDRAANEIGQHPEAIVDVYGFADPTGSDAYNLSLGQRRADEVVRALVAQTPGQLSKYAAVSYGERNYTGMAPDAPGNDHARRVVVALIRRTPLGEQQAPSAEMLKP